LTNEHDSAQIREQVDAIEWSKGFRKIVGDGESEIVQVFGAEDMAHM